MNPIYDLPPWQFGGLTIVVFVAVALGGLVATRAWFRGRGLHALVDNGVIGWIFSAILVIYAIAIGLTAVQSWGNEERAAGEASDEASRIAALYRDLSGYPDPPRTELRALLRDYTRVVIEEEWPVQRRGEIPEGGNAVLEGFERLLFSFAPANDNQRIAYAEALRTYNQLLEERRERLEAVEYAVPGELWGVVIAGAIISLAASWVFRLESLTLHGLMTGLLAAMIGLVVFFIATIDRPYRGKDSVTPFAYEILLHDLMGKETPRPP